MAECVDCGAKVNSRAARCKSCAARERWRLAKLVDPNAQWGAKYPPRTCKRCGKQFPWEHQGRSAYCSPECRRNRVEKVCAGCGERFSVPVSNGARYTYCSRACKVASGAAGPPVDLECACCGVVFRAGRSAVLKGRRYCSNRCRFAATGESSIEARVRVVLIGLGLDFVQEAPIGPWVVDFLVGDLVIEADGTYWHSLDRDTDERKTADLEARGYVVWRVPEVEITAEDFPDRFALRLMEWTQSQGRKPRDIGTVPHLHSSDLVAGSR